MYNEWHMLTQHSSWNTAVSEKNWSTGRESCEDIPKRDFQNNHAYFTFSVLETSV